MSKNLTHLTRQKGLNNNLFDKLQEAAAITGAPPEETLTNLSKEYKFGEANLLGASSFYDFLKPANAGKKAYICNGTSCMLAGKQPTVRAAISKHYNDDEIGDVCCLGMCHENASFQVDRTNYSGNDIVHIDEIITQQSTRHTVDYYYTEAMCAQPVLMHTPLSLKDYYALYDRLKESTASDIINIIQSSGLRGRGGAGYPTGLKMESCHNATSQQKYIVCNADEGDPGSFSDRFLLEHHPHAVLFGMLISGRACGADTGIIYIRSEYPKSIKSIVDAVQAYDELNLTRDIKWPFTFKIIKGAGSYVCGEETALLASIEGQRPEVRIRPPYPTEYGLYGRPTLVNNVETLANLHYILEHGADIYRSIGTDSSTGTKLVSLDGQFNRPGVYEVNLGTALSTIINDCGQGFKIPVKAIQIGGPLGGIVPKSEWSRLSLDFESLEAAGFSLGHGSFVAIPTDFPMIQYMEHLFSFAAHESCGKCFPCRLGTQRGMEMIQNAIGNKEYINPELFMDLLETLKFGSLCGLGSELPIPIKNILQYFSNELEPFFAHKLSPAL